VCVCVVCVYVCVVCVCVCEFNSLKANTHTHTRISEEYCDLYRITVVTKLYNTNRHLHKRKNVAYS